MSGLSAALKLGKRRDWLGRSIMASFFQKVLWTECTGGNNAKCPKFVNRERMPAFRKRCGECGSDAREVVKADPIKVVAAGVLFLLLCSGASWAASASLRHWTTSLFDHGSSPPTAPADPPTATTPPPARAALTWTFEAEQNGDRRTLSPGRDFSANGAIFRTNEVFHQGDRLRLEATANPLMPIYVFYRNGDDVRRLAANDGGQVTVPSASEWFKLDSRAGTEEFILIASNQRLSKLDEMTGNNLEAAALNSEIRDLSVRKDVALARVQVRHE
jgi:hypothetical protein